MKFYYPRFLKTNPSFVGLSIFDLFIMVGALILSVVLNFGSIGSLVMIAVSIGIFKLVTLKYSPHFFSLFFTKTDKLKWRAKVRSLMSGVLI